MVKGRKRGLLTWGDGKWGAGEGRMNRGGGRGGGVKFARVCSVIYVKCGAGVS